jgi:DNA-binding NarL/FixJ family response regulator
MANTGKAQQGSGSEPTGEKHPGIGPPCARHAANDRTHCGLCALLRRNGSADPRRTGSSAAHGLLIALVSDDAEVRLAVRRMVETQRDGWSLTVYAPHRRSAICDGSCPKTAPPATPERPPDIVLIALRDGELSRLDCVRRLKALAPDLRVLVIGPSGDEAAIVQYCMAGADGYLPKPVAPKDLRHAVSAVAQGGAALCPAAQRALLNVLHRATTATVAWAPGLTRREQEIAGCVVAHLSNKEISSGLGIDEETVHVHLLHLYRKLHVQDRHQAAAKLLGGGRKVTHFNPYLLLAYGSPGCVMVTLMWRMRD